MNQRACYTFLKPISMCNKYIPIHTYQLIHNKYMINKWVKFFCRFLISLKGGGLINSDKI